MKKYVIAVAALITALLFVLNTQAQTSSTPNAPDASAAAAVSTCPMLNVIGLKPNEGTLMIAVYASAEWFFKKPAWMTAQKVSANTTMQIPVCGIDSEEIAVTAFQDLNANQKLDSNPIGIPTEPFAASGTPAMFGAPTWKDTKVAYKGATAPIVVKF